MTMPFILLWGFPFFPTFFHGSRVYLHSIQSLLFFSFYSSPSQVSLLFQFVRVYWLTDYIYIYIPG